MANKIVAGQRVSTRKIERAKDLRRNMTPAERVLWDELRTNRLDGLHFRRQQIIDGFIVDFYCHAAGVAIEVDGAIHTERAEYDAERNLVMARHGLLVLRISNEEVRDELPGMLARITATCRGRL